MTYTISSTCDSDSVALIMFCKANGFQNCYGDGKAINLKREHFDRFLVFMAQFSEMVTAVEGKNVPHHWGLECQADDND